MNSESVLGFPAIACGLSAIPLFVFLLFFAFRKSNGTKVKRTITVLIPCMMMIACFALCRPLEFPFLNQMVVGWNERGLLEIDGVGVEHNVLEVKPEIAELAFIPIYSGFSYLYVFDTTTNKQTYYSSLTSNQVRGVSLTQDGTRAYVAVDAGVHVINTVTYSRIETISVGGNPSLLVTSPDNSRLYVIGTLNNNVSVIDTLASRVVASIAVGNQPDGLVLTPDGSRLYVASWGSNNVQVIDTTELRVLAVIPVGARPTGIAISPDGTRVYVANFLSDTVAVIDTTKNQVILSIPIPVLPDQHPQRVWLTPKGDRAYVSLWSSNTILVLNTLTNEVTSTSIQVGLDPIGLAFTFSGSSAYVVSPSNRTVFVIDVVNHQLKTSFEGPGDYRGIAIAYVFSK